MGQESGQTLGGSSFQDLTEATMELSCGLCSPVEFGVLFLTLQVIEEIQFLAALSPQPSAQEASLPHKQFPS